MPERVYSAIQGKRTPQNSQSQNTESSVLHPLTVSTLYYDTTGFLNLTTSTCNSHNQTAMKIPYVSLSLHFDLLFLLIFMLPFSPFWQALSWWPRLTQQFLLHVSNQSSPLPHSWNNTDSLHVLLLTFLEGSRERACGPAFLKLTILTVMF